MKVRCLALIAPITLASVFSLLISHSASGDSLASPYDDEFNSSQLNSRWFWYDEDPTRWSLTMSPGNLRIIGTQGDMRSCNNAGNYLLQDSPPGDYELYTKIVIDPNSSYQQAGMLIFVDQDNYIKLDVNCCGRSVEFLQEQQGVFPGSWPYFAVDLGKPAYLKLTRLGGTYSGYYSADNVQWTLVGRSVCRLP